MTQPYFSIIVVTYNNLRQTIGCIESLLASRLASHHTIEILVVDNGSNDGSRAWLEDQSRNHECLHLLKQDHNTGWCRAANLGLERARGNCLVLLNNDVRVPQIWLEGLHECLLTGEEQVADAGRVGIVGPMTNAAGGRQETPGPSNPDSTELNHFAGHFHQEHERQWVTSSFISGFCMMIHRDCYTDIGGLDERFSPGGFDDNDFVLRAAEAGWSALIAGDVFVYHEGSATFRTFFPESSSLDQRQLFYDKWRARRFGKNRLVAIYRVKNAADTLLESLDATARFADRIVVLDDGSTDETGTICKNHRAVSVYEYQDLPFDERRDRNHLLELASRCNPDWIIAIDGDEVFEMDRARAERLMLLADPHVKVLGFHWYTFWEAEHDWFRADGIFGRMSGYRMFRAEPCQKITAGTENGLHCGNIPVFPRDTCRYTDIRVRHLGYDTEQRRLAKYAFYGKMDQTPRADLVGNTTYEHLRSSTVMLRRYPEKNGVSLCIITRNEAGRLAAFLSAFEPFVDEICIVDTGSTDQTLEIAEQFTDRIERFSMPELALDRARNRSIALARHPWILSLDPDEVIDQADLAGIRRLMDDADVHAWSFEVANHQKGMDPVFTLAIRLFRNHPDIFYSRPVHETVEQSLRAMGAVVQPAGIRIQHYGFLKSDRQVQAKIDAYYRCNREYREAHPEDPLPWYNEALHYLNEGREDEAISFLEKALALDPAFLSPRAQLAFLHQEHAIRLWQGLVSFAAPDHPVFEQAHQALQQLLALTPERPYVGEARCREDRE